MSECDPMEIRRQDSLRSPEERIILSDIFPFHECLVEVRVKEGLGCEQTIN